MERRVFMSDVWGVFAVAASFPLRLLVSPEAVPAGQSVTHFSILKAEVEPNDNWFDQLVADLDSTKDRGVVSKVFCNGKPL